MFVPSDMLMSPLEISLKHHEMYNYRNLMFQSFQESPDFAELCSPQ